MRCRLLIRRAVAAVEVYGRGIDGTDRVLAFRGPTGRARRSVHVAVFDVAKVGSVVMNNSAVGVLA